MVKNTPLISTVHKPNKKKWAETTAQCFALFPDNYKVHSHSKGYHSIDVQLFHLMMFTLNQFSHWLVQLWAIILKELYKFFFSHYMGATYIRLDYLVLFKQWTTQIDFFSTFSSRIHIQFFSLNISFPYHLNNFLVSLLEAL